MAIRIALLVGWLLGFPLLTGCKAELALDKIVLPPGFAISLYSDQLPGARSLALSPSGILYVGTREEGKVYAVLDRDGDRRADRLITVAEGLNQPNGVAFRDGALYVAEISRILRYSDLESHLENPGRPEIVYDRLPTRSHHGWKFIRFGPDGRLYVPVGAPCNICEPGDPYAAILRLNPEGGEPEIFARGIRNTVGFDWEPKCGELWFTDNGRDWLGDDRPSDELNHAPRPGLHFGYPYRHGREVADPEYGQRQPAGLTTTPPALELGAHVAALGMRFYTGGMFPAEYRERIFIAEHGSWNRTDPAGYRLISVILADNKAIRQEVFASGWLAGRTAWGRPVDLLVMPDGSLLVSDDKAGAVYRITYHDRN
jgi:glucose/arabinose dehydrogenase